MEEKSAKITNNKANPTSIVPGESIELKMQFKATTDVFISKFFLDILSDGVSLFTDNAIIGKTYSEGVRDVIGYSATIPSFCLPGP